MSIYGGKGSPITRCVTSGKSGEQDKEQLMNSDPDLQSPLKNSLLETDTLNFQRLHYWIEKKKCFKIHKLPQNIE